MAVASPFFSSLPLHDHGLEYIYPRFAAAHPFDGGLAALLGGTVEETAGRLGADEDAYLRLLEPLVKDWPIYCYRCAGSLAFSCPSI
jgi:phytoene dehydrogenase-like protein